MSDRAPSAGRRARRRPAGGAAASAAPRGGKQARPQGGVAPRLYERVFDILSSQIERGQLTPDTRLQESGLAAQFGISRAPARQALAELLRQGFIEKAPGQGYIVRAMKRRGKISALNKEDAGDLRLVSSSSWERIYGEVEGEIVARIAFGPWRVNEAELARSYNVSRTVARDVVGRLQQRGLVRKGEGSRWYAPALTPEHVGELYEMRWLLEPVALRKAAPNVSPEFIAALRANVDHAIANATEIGGATLDQLETELHIALLGHCGQQTLMQTITLHQSLLIAHRFLYRWTPRLFATEPFLPEHLEILEQLGGGRIEDAARSLEHHLRVSLERAVARIDAVVQDAWPEELPYLERFNPA